MVRFFFLHVVSVCVSVHRAQACCALQSLPGTGLGQGHSAMCPEGGCLHGRHLPGAEAPLQNAVMRGSDGRHLWGTLASFRKTRRLP